MSSSLTRRDFLKLASLLPFSYLPAINTNPISSAEGTRQNILIFVFDAWSAENISLYGYPRKTTPHLEKLAQKAIVYHNHFAGGHYTTPGTASLLTGTSPWTHRAFNFNDTVPNALVDNNLFRTFPHHQRLAYTHNPLADTLLRQCMRDIEEYFPWESLYMESDRLITELFRNDSDVASIGLNRILKRLDDGYSYSLYLAALSELYKKKSIEFLEPSYPLGVPNHDGLSFFSLESSIDWLIKQLRSTDSPFMGYFHLFPPHDPYTPRADYHDVFSGDDFEPIKKTDHFLGQDVNPGWMRESRRRYDEYILNVDAEFARLYASLEASGATDNTWLVLTSDHGEMFERNIKQHSTPVFYQPIIHIPLLIFPPGNQSRVDIYANTSAIDILPTLSAISGQKVPTRTEGEILPPFAESNSGRAVSSVQLDYINDHGEIIAATAMLVQNNYKLTWYFGYSELQEQSEFIELFDIEADPQELNDLFPQNAKLAQGLLDELEQRMDELRLAYKDQS